MTNLFSNDGEEKAAAGPDKLCPFIGNMAVPLVKQSSIERAGPPMIAGLEAKLFPCQGSLCTFWNGAGCNINAGIETLKRLEKSLAPLAKFMG